MKNTLFTKANFDDLKLEFETKERVIREIELVTLEYCKDDNNYNLKEGGGGGDSFRYINLNPHLRNGFEHRPDDLRMLRKRQNLIFKEMLKDDEYAKIHKRKISEGLKERYKLFPKVGIPHTEEAKNKIGTANSISQSGEKNSQFGKMWITDGINNKKINKDEKLPEGWRKGRIMGCVYG
jgi:hypothetical protein